MVCLNALEDNFRSALTGPGDDDAIKDASWRYLAEVVKPLNRTRPAMSAELVECFCRLRKLCEDSSIWPAGPDFRGYIKEMLAAAEERQDDLFREVFRSGSTLYCIGEAWGGPVKIGFARDPVARLNQLKTGNYAPIRLLGFQQNRPGLEAAIHAVLRPLQVNGEWFDDRHEYVRAAFDMAERNSPIYERKVLRRMEMETEREAECGGFYSVLHDQLSARLARIRAEERIAVADAACEVFFQSPPMN